MTLEQLMNHIRSIFSTRNERLDNMTKRLAFLTAGIHQLEKACYNSNSDVVDSHQVDRWLASVFARWVAAISMVPDTKPAEDIARKYGAYCSYCNKFPCGCSTIKRSDPVIRVAGQIQLTWSLEDWQRHLASLYGERNQKRGLDYAFLKLYSEAAECLANSLLLSIERRFDTRSRVRYLQEELVFELADVFARLLAVATLLNIDLEKVVIECYKDGCMVCHRLPCSCDATEYLIVGKAETTTV